MCQTSNGVSSENCPLNEVWHIRDCFHPSRLIFEVPEKRLAFSYIQDVLHSEDVEVGVNGGQLDSFALLPKSLNVLLGTPHPSHSEAFSSHS